ncbi:MAG: peptidoglycan bridge formation glycyltransferase FemA/FemB family protein [Chloroflexi bacterium]|nr:peptidoglycan bridge formation glycyltransferase FemA/FemB family protein [Chloroflexota bacterium]
MEFQVDPNDWNSLISQLPNPHLLQTREWAEAKKPFGWEAHYKIWQDSDGGLLAAAQILQRSIRIPASSRNLSMLYVPKGPLLHDWSDAALRERVLAGLADFARDKGAFFIKVDPDVNLGVGLPNTIEENADPTGTSFVNELMETGWRFSNEQVQMRNTMLVDLRKTEGELLTAMKQKTRYNLRLAERKGVKIRHGNPQDFPLLYHMYAETSVRDGFVIRSEVYYLAVWERFFKAGMLTPLIAEVEGQAVAGLMLFTFGKQSWYLYGMSRDQAREWMPNYLLQWEAIKASQRAGCETYDLWGAPDEFNESDPMWGVYRFKVGLGAYEARRIGAWDLPIQPLVYSLYTQVLPRIISVMRWRGRRGTRRQVLAGEPG